MRRATVLCTMVVAAIAWTPGAATAGGGSCHTGATQADGTGKETATVRMIDACFTASITRVDPGTAVTFVNDDVWFTHNVNGSEWGQFEDMSKGDAFTATFDAPGLYPFACSYHPGMTGAIVIGDGMGAGSGAAITIEPVEPTPKAALSVAAEPGGRPLGAAAGAGLLGLAIGAIVTRAIGHRISQPVG